MSMAEKPINRLAAMLDRPFQGTTGLQGPLDQQQLIRIANASEYAAGQLYEIRELLKLIAAK